MSIAVISFLYFLKSVYLIILLHELSRQPWSIADEEMPEIRRTLRTASIDKAWTEIAVDGAFMHAGGQCD